MGLLDRKKLLEKEKLETVRVDLGDGDFVYVRQMTGHERDVFERSLYVMGQDNKPMTRLEDFRAKLAVVTISDEAGNALLEPKDYLTLSNSMSAARLEKIVTVSSKLNAITPEDKEALIKNSEVGQADDSNSSSV